MASQHAFDSMKYEVAQEVGVPLKQGYNGDITAREAGKIGGTIVQKVFEQYKGSHQSAGQEK
nr:alpha/beta-type small acid-soluble spore protein [uncultured Cellulosilyticum sp.]